MERVLSVEEKIRRAEEIYERRKNENYRNTTATVNVSGKNKDFKLLKKMIIQILICLLIYFIFYLIQTTNYVFSASTINKTKEILDYDMDVKGIYDEIKNNFINNQEEGNKIDNSINEENIEGKEDNYQKDNENNDETNIEETNNEEELNKESDNKDGIIEENKEEANTEQTNNEEITQNEPITVAQEVLNNYSIIKPVTGGFISSEFGTREPEGDIVTSYHHGIDIGVVTGTEIAAAIDGEVILATESESYGKYVKIQNGDLVTLYAHCSELLVTVGSTVKQGDIIAKSGETGKVTGPHLHFEITYKDEYLNPREVLEF